MTTAKRQLATLILFVLSAASLSADTIILKGDLYPPYVMTTSATGSGFVVDVLQAILEKVVLFP